MNSQERIDFRVENFTKFYNSLMRIPPKGFTPWFFPCEKNNKNPDGRRIFSLAKAKSDCCKSIWKNKLTKKQELDKIESEKIGKEYKIKKAWRCDKCENTKGSWHMPHARLSKEQCIEHIKLGFNIGISARTGDALIIGDIDEAEYLEQLPTNTLTSTSRKRAGGHFFGWDKDGSAKINIPTDYGEMRSNNAYVLAPGSCVPFKLDNTKDKKAFDKLPKEAREDEYIGFYTVRNPISPVEMGFSDLPLFFREREQENESIEILQEDKKDQKDFNGEGKYTELFNLKVSDIIGKLPSNKRTGHPLHESDTDANFSLALDGAIGQCWRHTVSLNAVQYLCVQAGYSKCNDAGTPHKQIGVSKRTSRLKGDKKAFEVAYKEAIKLGLIKEYKGLSNRKNKKVGVEDYYNLFKESIEESYFNQNKEPYITIKVKEHKEHHQINSQAVKDIILITCHKSGLGTPTEQNINQIISMLRAECLIENKTQQVNLRFYQTTNAIYYDPCRKDWKIYKILKENIELGYFDNIKFERFNHMKESTPDLNAEIEDIKFFLNDFEMNDSERLLSKVNLIYTYLQKPKPIDNISGAMGSGKTVATKQIRQIPDPSELEVLFFPETSEELLLLAKQHAILPFDNIRHINNKTSDILCSISTGASTSQRKLYTNGETQITKIQRKIMMNGINRSGDNSDYADRSIELKLKRIPTTKRKTETEVWKTFNQNKSKVQGSCLKILQKTLTIIDTIELKSIPRMADFAVWGEAISQAMGEEKNKFIDIYFEKINNLSEEILEANDVARTILIFADMKKEWQGTPGEFYKEINYVAENILKINVMSKYWINSPIGLSKKINEFLPVLEYKNIFITRGKKNGIRFIKIQDKTKIEKEEEDIKFLILEKLKEDKNKMFCYDEIEDYNYFITHNHISLHELRLELNKLKQEGVIHEPKENHYQYLG